MHLRKSQQSKKRLKSAKSPINNIQISFNEHNTNISPRLAAQVVREYLLPMLSNDHQKVPSSARTSSVHNQLLLSDQLQTRITELETELGHLREDLERAGQEKQRVLH